MKHKLLVGLAAATLGGAAFGQIPFVNPIAVRVGVNNLVGGTHFTPSGGFTVGAGMDLPLQFMGGKLSADLDFSDHQGHGNTIQTLSLQAVVRQPLVLQVGTPLGKVGPYYGLGVGLFRSQLSGGFSDTATRVGGSALLGFQFTDLIAAEAFYRLSGSVDGVRTDTIGVAVTFHI